jgi:DNA end-binding protein Ku
MAPRANSKGYLKLSLVSCAVTLFPTATTRDRFRFNIINRETGNRVHYQVVDADTGEEVPPEDRVKGRSPSRRSAPKHKKLKRAS